MGGTSASPTRMVMSPWGLVATTSTGHRPAWKRLSPPSTRRPRTGRLKARSLGFPEAGHGREPGGRKVALGWPAA